MFESLTNADISNAVDELITCFGVKEEVPFQDLIALLRKKDVEGCVQEMAIRLGLPVRISLTYVQKDFRPGFTDGFHSSALARTDWTGRGIEGIIAQVSIPEYLPMFGTLGLQGYPIRVRVSENCHADPDTFVAIMAHELSHVLLASLWHPQKNNELYTDLVPILLGFHEVVRRGRSTYESTTSGNTTTTQTTTYGYLSDSQFDFACSYLTGILQHHQRDKKHLIEVVKKLKRKLKKAVCSLAAFRDYFNYCDRHLPDKMRKEHAERIVQLHVHDYSRQWESCISAAKTSQEVADYFVRHLNHYTRSAVEQLKTHTQIVELANVEISKVTEEITKDEKILRRYVGLIYRIRRTLGYHS